MGTNILIIDDDADDRMIFCEALLEVLNEPNCIEKNSCSGVRELLVSDLEIKAIFIDGFMHPTTGEQCLKELGPLIDRSKTKVIIHSGAIHPRQKDEFEHLGVDDVMEKGSSFEEIKHDLKTLLVDKYGLK